MLDPVVQSKIKLIQVQTKRLMQSSIAGDYLSAFKGSGLEFNQLREYQQGDDVRFIDWNSSAKMDKIMVKQFIEERDRTIIIAIDISTSSLYSSTYELRQATIAQVAATLSYIAHVCKDKVGVLFFSDQVEKWIPPSRGSAHVGSIIDTIFSFKPAGKKTSINEALRFLIKLKKRNAVIFMLSDWIDADESYKKLLKIAGVEYDFIGVRLLDTCESTFPDIGLLEVVNPETDMVSFIDTRKTRTLLNPLNLFLKKRIIEQKKLFDKYSVDLLDLPVGKPFVNTLISFFHLRTRRQI